MLDFFLGKCMCPERLFKTVTKHWELGKCTVGQRRGLRGYPLLIANVKNKSEVNDTEVYQHSFKIQ